MENLEHLIEAIRSALGPTSGLDSDDIDHNQLIALIEAYRSEESDWHPFAFFDANRNYTRNLVDDTNGKSNILVVCWNPGKGSPIHDHAKAHCIMKILQGTLRETLYSNPDQDHTATPQPFKQTMYTQDEVTYISDKIGLHKIENASDTEPAISLHLYTPPHAHNYGFNLFDEKSGKKLHVKGAPLFSRRGELCENSIPARM